MGRSHSYLIDAGLCIQEEELDGGIVLQVGDAFYIESAREKPCVRHRGSGNQLHRAVWFQRRIAVPVLNEEKTKGPPVFSPQPSLRTHHVLYPCVQAFFSTYTQGQ